MEDLNLSPSPRSGRNNALLMENKANQEFYKGYRLQIGRSQMTPTARSVNIGQQEC